MTIELDQIDSDQYDTEAIRFDIETANFSEDRLCG
jgi:hypothetical protein